MEQYRMADYTGGVGEDRAIVGPGKFQYSKSIDCRSNLRGLVLMNKLTSDTQPFDGLVNTLYTVPGTGSVVAPQSNGKVFEFNGSAWSTDKASYSTSTNKDIKTVVEYAISGTAYLLYIAQAKIHRAFDSNASFTQDVYTFTPSSTGSNRPAFVSSRTGNMYFGGGEYLFQMDPTGGITKMLTLAPGQNIVGITEFNRLFRIYTTTAMQSYVYLWDGASKSFTYCTPLSGVRVQSVASVPDGNDQLICLEGVYISNGYVANKMLHAFSQTGSSRLFFGPCMFSDTNLYFGGAENKVNGLFSMGNYFVGSPKALLQDHSFGTTEDSQNFRGVTRAFSQTFVAYGATVSTVSRYVPVGQANFADSGEFWTPIFYAGDAELVKQSHKLTVSYDLASANGHGGTIGVYYRIDETASWTLLDTISDATKKRQIFLGNQFTLNEWNQIEFKYVLTPSTDKTKTPFFQSGTLEYEVIKS